VIDVREATLIDDRYNEVARVPVVGVPKQVEWRGRTFLHYAQAHPVGTPEPLTYREERTRWW
jgi:hypothetical protein